MTTGKPQTTDFTKDVLGRYINNGMDEALNSTNKNGQRPDGSPTGPAIGPYARSAIHRRRQDDAYRCAEQ